jgi:hypothetical protein
MSNPAPLSRTKKAGRSRYVVVPNSIRACGTCRVKGHRMRNQRPMVFPLAGKSSKWSGPRNSKFGGVDAPERQVILVVQHNSFQYA